MEVFPEQAEDSPPASESAVARTQGDRDVCRRAVRKVRRYPASSPLAFIWFNIGVATRETRAGTNKIIDRMLFTALKIANSPKPALRTRLALHHQAATTATIPQDAAGIENPNRVLRSCHALDSDFAMLRARHSFAEPTDTATKAGRRRPWQYRADSPHQCVKHQVSSTLAAP